MKLIRKPKTEPDEEPKSPKKAPQPEPKPKRVKLKPKPKPKAKPKTLTPRKRKPAARKTKPKRKKPAPRQTQTIPKKTAKVQADKEFGRIGTLKDDMHERFCQQAIISPSATEAYVRANPGIARASAKTMASRLLSKVDVVRRITELLTEAADETIMSKREALRILTERGRADLADYVSLGLDGVTPSFEFGKNMPNSKAIKKIKTRSEVTGKDGDEIKQAIVTDIEVHDGDKAIMQLGKLLGWETPEELSVNVTGKLTVEELIDDAAGATRGLQRKPKGEDG